MVITLPPRTTIDRLQELESILGELVEKRRSTVEAAEYVIAQANRKFDDAAVPLQRQINRLRGNIEQPAKPTPAKPMLDPAGLTDEEQEHYRQLWEKTQSNKKHSGATS